MRYRLLGNTGFYVSELCLGTMTFGGKGFFAAVGKVDQATATKLVARALDAGVNFIDTADVYSLGLSETMVGTALKELGIKRSEVVIATKVYGRMSDAPNDAGLSRGHILDAVEASLKRLQTDHIDLYQLHGQDAVTPVEDVMGTLNDLVRRGLVRYAGVSNWQAWRIMKAQGLAAQHGWARFEALQAYYSIAGRDIERDVVPLLADQKMGLMVWSPLAGGILSGKFRREGKGPEDARRSTFDFPPVDKDLAFTLVEAMAEIGAGHGVGPARVALAWVLTRPFVSSVILGVKTLNQLNDNLAAAEFKLSAEEIARLDAASALKPEYPGWMVERQNDPRRNPNTK